MMKSYLKNEKGITIAVLVITIIVMVILATVSFQAIIPEEGEILEQTEEVKEKFELQGQIEKIHNALDYNYYLNSGRELTEASETVEKLAKIIKETEISANKFVIYYDTYIDETTGNRVSEDMIFYRTDLVTSEEKVKLENNINVRGEFVGDANLDGVLSKEDIKLIVDENDKILIQKVISGEKSIKSLYNNEEE